MNRTHADSLPPCLGWNSQISRWGIQYLQGERKDFTCAPGEAVMLLVTPSGRPQLLEEITPQGSCCPLPKGAVMDSHVYSPVSCPEDTVMTGAREVSGSALDSLGKKRHYELRCSKINSQFFQLGKIQQGAQLDSIPDLRVVMANFLQAQETRILQRAMLPVELRFGLGRTSRSRWEGGCVGLPWGSLLVKIGKRCDEALFRELRTRDGQALETPCIGINDIYSESGSCLRELPGFSSESSANR